MSDSDEDEVEPLEPPRTLRALATETKMLYRDVIQFSSSPRVVDLSALHAKRARTTAGEGEAKKGTTTRGWMRRKDMPAQQVLERRMEAERLSRRVRGLMDRASAL